MSATYEKNINEYLLAVIHRHEVAIKSIAAFYYRPGSYSFNALVCDLTTYLWKVYTNLPPDCDIYNEEAWAYSILYFKALNLTRNEERYQNHMVYGTDLSTIADDNTPDPLISKMYYLIHQLDDEEQELIAQYFAYGNMLKLSNALGVNYMKVVRRISRIQKKLIRLNKTLGNDFDINSTFDDKAPPDDANG